MIALKISQWRKGDIAGPYMKYPKIHRCRSTRVAALTAHKTNTRKEISESFNIPLPTLDGWKREAKASGTMVMARPAFRKIRSDAGR